jgi:D-xylose transport system substrate-binding protein
MLAIAAAGVLVTTFAAACNDSKEAIDAGGNGDKARVGVILPDNQTYDPEFFKAAFSKAGVPAEIRSAVDDRAQFLKIGDEMINNGVKVLIIANLDSSSGKLVLDKAGAKKIPTIDYDRLTVNGGADYYVSFDNEQIGEMQGYGLAKCLQATGRTNPLVAELNGAPEDSNATLYKNGYDRVLQPHFDTGAYVKGPDQFVPGWSGAEAGRIFEQMMKQQPKITAVVAANDDLAGAVIKVLRAKGLTGKVPVTGQNATVEGLRNVLTGDQCMTVYKRTSMEAGTAVNLAVKLFKGEQPTVGARITDPESGADVPFLSLPPISIGPDQVKDVVADGFVTKKELCPGDYLTLCNKAGVK